VAGTPYARSVARRHRGVAAEGREVEAHRADRVAVVLPGCAVVPGRRDRVVGDEDAAVAGGAGEVDVAVTHTGRGDVHARVAGAGDGGAAVGIARGHADVEVAGVDDARVQDLSRRPDAAALGRVNRRV